MKVKMSITVDEDILDKIEGKLDEGLFRNKSHVIEYSLKKFLEAEKCKAE